VIVEFVSRCGPATEDQIAEERLTEVWVQEGAVVQEGHVIAVVDEVNHVLLGGLEGPVCPRARLGR
jgi:hypothetical protein